MITLQRSFSATKSRRRAERFQEARVCGGRGAPFCRRGRAMGSLEKRRIPHPAVPARSVISRRRARPLPVPARA